MLQPEFIYSCYFPSLFCYYLFYRTPPLTAYSPLSTQWPEESCENINVDHVSPQLQWVHFSLWPLSSGLLLTSIPIITPPTPQLPNSPASPVPAHCLHTHWMSCESSHLQSPSCRGACVVCSPGNAVPAGIRVAQITSFQALLFSEVFLVILLWLQPWHSLALLSVFYFYIAFITF